MSHKKGQNIFNLLIVSIATFTIVALFYIKLFNPELLQNSQSDLPAVQVNISQEVINKALAGTVSIQGRTYNGDTLLSSSSGSGFFINEDGLILTNEHVINGCNLIFAVDCTGKSTRAELVSSDKRIDVALLTIISDEKQPYLEFGNTSNLRYGQSVIAAGNPLNNGSDGRAIVTFGRISKLNEKCNISPDFANDRFYDNLIQFDASVFPGSSGGPLLDENGYVIGIVSAVSRDDSSRRTGFAINLDQHTQNAIDILLSGESIEYGFLGAVLADEIPHTIVSQYNLNNLSGGYVSSVLPGSPAISAGIVPGDIILTISGKAVNNRAEIISLINKSTPGNYVKIELLHPSYSIHKNYTVTAKIEKRTLENRNGYFEEISLPASEAWGIVVKPLTKWRRNKESFPNSKSGLLIYEVNQDSLAFRQGLKPGDIITKIDNQPVANLSDFNLIVSKSAFSPRFQTWKSTFPHARN